ncbi:MAG: hypothetical protein EXR86_16630 [Gammaproteobacteria bacterium]|nr:hypothetical protein [Gammaproteobacteria bacterium]
MSNIYKRGLIIVTKANALTSALAVMVVIVLDGPTAIYRVDTSNVIVIAGSTAMYRGDTPNVDAVNKPYKDAFTMYGGLSHESREAPWGNPELAASRGEEAGQRDLEKGIRQVVLFGLIAIDEFRAFGYALHSGGCGVGGDDQRYWSAYNDVMVEAGRKQFGDRFPDAGLHLVKG